MRISVRMSAGTVGRPMRRRLLQVHHSRKPRRCQAMTVSGLTMTSAVRHLVQRREHDPEATVCLRKPQPPRPGSLEHLQLVPQGQYFELQRGARMRPRSQGQKKGQQHRHHGPEAYPSSAATSTAATRTDFSVGTAPGFGRDWVLANDTLRPSPGNAFNSGPNRNNAHKATCVDRWRVKSVVLYWPVFPSVRPPRLRTESQLD